MTNRIPRFCTVGALSFAAFCAAAVYDFGNHRCSLVVARAFEYLLAAGYRRDRGRRILQLALLPDLVRSKVSPAAGLATPGVHASGVSPRFFLVSWSARSRLLSIGVGLWYGREQSLAWTLRDATTLFQLPHGLVAVSNQPGGFTCTIAVFCRGRDSLFSQTLGHSLHAVC